MSLPQNLTTLISKAYVVHVTSNDHKSYYLPLRAYLEEERNGYDSDGSRLAMRMMHEHEYV